MDPHSIHLTPEELRAVTGRSRWTAQIRWLRANGFTVLQRADGMPLVSRAHFELMMGGAEADASSKRQVEPDYDAL